MEISKIIIYHILIIQDCFAYLDEREIIISYNREHPFGVEQISILIDSENTLYAVFECGIFCTTDVQAKDVAKQFTQQLIELVANFTAHNI